MTPSGARPDARPVPAGRDTPRPGSIAWFNCGAGVAGDMLLGALVDAGADPDEVAAAIAGLGVDGYALMFERVQRCGVTATLANVVVDHDGHVDHDGRAGHDAHQAGHGHGHGHRPAREVVALIEAADLPDRVRRRAIAAYRALAEVEGQIHGIDPDDVELHEVGALDAIVDVVGACAALESLGVERLSAGPISVGVGTIEAAHGTLPNPAPAVVRLLARVEAPMRGIDTAMELATPTGVALLVALADGFGPPPAMSVTSVGFGAGTADPPGRPNVVNVVIGRPIDHTDATGATGAGRACRLLEANVDDATPEVLAHTIAQLLDAGAHDAWVTPMIMKKGRPAHTVHALCDDAAAQRIATVLTRETGTLGLRGTTVERWPQRRRETVTQVGGHDVRVKLGDHRAKAEYDDAARAAASLGWPLRDVLRLAEGQVRDEQPD